MFNKTLPLKSREQLASFKFEAMMFKSLMGNQWYGLVLVLENKISLNTI